jgi:hypothetical protein
MPHRLLAVFLVVLSGCLSQSAWAQSKPNKGQIAKAIAAWEEEDYLIPIGRVTVTRSGMTRVDPALKSQIAIADFSKYLAPLKAAGLITFAPNPLAALNQAEAVDVTLEMTPLGRSFVTNCVAVCRIDAGSTELRSVVETKTLRQPPYSYSVVKLTYARKYVAPLKEFFASLEPRPPTYKAVVLLRWDDFRQEWQIIAEDRSRLDEDFIADRVGATLRSLGL